MGTNQKQTIIIGGGLLPFPWLNDSAPQTYNPTVQNQVLRRFPTMSQETAEIYAEAMRHLALKARGVARDLNPKGEMKYMRIRAKRHEVLVAFGEKTINLSIGPGRIVG